jgi:sec-independent protein translocase protein TatB
MFDVAPSEFMLVAALALLVIGPKDLPKVMRVVGKWVGKARAVAGQFRSGFDNMVREAELEEMEKKWKAENDRIMQMHPTPPAVDADSAIPDPQDTQSKSSTPEPGIPEPSLPKSSMPKPNTDIAP